MAGLVQRQQLRGYFDRGPAPTPAPSTQRRALPGATRLAPAPVAAVELSSLEDFKPLQMENLDGLAGPGVKQPFIPPSALDDRSDPRFAAVAHALQNMQTADSLGEALALGGKAFFDARAERNRVNDERSAENRDADALAAAINASKSASTPEEAEAALIDMLGANRGTAATALDLISQRARGQIDRSAKREDTQFQADVETQAMRDRAPIETTARLEQQGYRLNPETGQYERFGPAADDWALKNREISAGNYRAGISARANTGLPRAIENADGDTLKQLREGSQTAMTLQSGLDQLSRLLGPGTTIRSGGDNWRADGGFWGDVARNPQENEYQAILDRLTPMMRQPGSGATSDFDARMFANALPSLRLDATARQNVIAAHQAQSRMAQERLQAAERYLGANSTLVGFDRIWGEYVNANTIFDPSSTAGELKLNQGRRSFDAWVSAGMPRAETAPGGGSEGPSTEDLQSRRAELERQLRASDTRPAQRRQLPGVALPAQPGGYRGR